MKLSNKQMFVLHTQEIFPYLIIFIKADREVMSGFYIKEILLDVILTKADVPVKFRLEKLPK